MSAPRQLPVRRTFVLAAALSAAALLCAPVPLRAQAVAGADSATQPTLQRIRQSGVITIAHREASIPFSYLDAGKQPTGYAIELCNRVAQAIRTEYKLPALRVQYLQVSAAERIPALLSGKADLECGNTTNTAARRKQVAFSVTHFFDGGRLLVPAKSGVQRLSDLRGKAIVVNKGSTHASFVNGQIQKNLFSARVVEAKDASEAFSLLERGEVEAYLHDGMVLASLRANAKQPEVWELTQEMTTVEPLAVMLRKDDPEFKRIVDTTISRVMVDGEIRGIWKRWFESPIPPNNINLGVPMNTLMRDQIRFPSDKVGDDLGG